LNVLCWKVASQLLLKSSTGSNIQGKSQLADIMLKRAF